MKEGEELALRRSIRLRMRFRRWLRSARRFLRESPPGDEAGGSGLAQLTSADRTRLSLGARVGIAVAVIAIGVLAFVNDLKGVDWGDDFALYMRQAKALVTGTIGDVVADNRYSLAHSGWSTFSPPNYPWGWPLLVAPVYAVFGLDYEVIKGLEVVTFCAFLLAFLGIVRRRAGLLTAGVVTLIVATSPGHLAATRTVISDMPYLCFVGLTLWWMDRCLQRDRYEPHRLALLGFLVAFTFNIRSEGITLIAALMAWSAVTFITRKGASSSGDARPFDLRTALLPFATLLLGILAFQVLLPGQLLPRAPGAGLHNALAHVTYYRDVLAEHVSLKDPGMHMGLFGSEGAAQVAIVVLIVLAIAGLMLRVAKHLVEDVALITFLCTSVFILAVSPYQEPRYILTVTPFLLYFASQALLGAGRVLGQRGGRAAGPVLVAALLPLVGVLALNVGDLVRSTRFHLEYEYIVEGPEAPSSQEMLQQVRRLTAADDVILFFRARAMTFYTDRRAIQSMGLEGVLEDVDWYAMAKGSTYAQPLLDDASAAAYGLKKAWENEDWVLWRAG